MRLKRNFTESTVSAIVIAVILLLVVGGNGVSAQEREGTSGVLKQVGGATSVAQFLGVDASGELLFDGSTPTRRADNQIWRFGADRGIIRGPLMVLGDGSRYAAPAVTTEDREFIFTPDEVHPGLWDGWRIAISEVRLLLFKPLHGKAALEQALTLSQPVATDALRLDNGDELHGEFRGIETELASQIDEIHFAVRDRVSRIPVSKAIFLRLAERGEAAANKPGDQWTLAFTDGSRVHVHEPVIEAKSVHWKSDKGQTREVNTEEFWKALTLVEPPRTSVIYLGELKEQSYRHLPIFGDASSWRVNRAAGGTPLLRGGAYYEKGVGMWSNSRLSFAVPANATQFAAEIGIDDSAGDGGSVIFRVLAQFNTAKGVELKDLFKSEIMRGGDASREVTVSLQGAASLILLVESADQGDALDLADWLDARFIVSKASSK